MRLRILAIGRCRPSPEKDLITEYLSRFDRMGRPLGLGPAKVHEIEDKRGGGKSAEGALLLKAVPTGAKLIALHEHGQLLTSPQFSQRLAYFRDISPSELIFVIGGADGLSKAVLERANEKLSFGRMVWAHMLARVMLAEQLYRGVSILAGGPYHRS
jgi:23S rRNA (pseudouridine1915-N3)-methyltransferase